MFKKLFMMGGVVALTLFSQACSTISDGSNSASHHFSSQDQHVLKTLKSDGVSVMRLGDDVVIIIPSSALFRGYSVGFSNSGRDILNQVATLLMPMNKIKITIAAYSSAMTQTDKDLLLTDWQAQAVSNYLWDHHVDARLFYAVGYGGGHPLQYAQYEHLDPSTLIGKDPNYRVEITLKDYVY